MLIVGIQRAGTLIVMARETIKVDIDADLVRRAREQPDDAGRSDTEVVERALTVFLGLRTLDQSHVRGGLDEPAANELADTEVRAVRAARG